MVTVILTFWVGFAGGWLAKKIKFPAPYMVGSMIAVGLVSALTSQMEMYRPIKIVAQIISGVYIGQQVTKKDLLNLPKLGSTIMALMALFTLNMLITGGLFIYVFKMDPVTAFLSCLPGGIMDVSLLSIDMGAQADVVATLQTARLVGILLILPNWVGFILRHFSPRTVNKTAEKVQVEVTPVKLSQNDRLCNDMSILAVATVAGLIGMWSGLPVGALIFSLLASAILKMRQNTIQLQPKIRYLAQILAGSIIGTNFTCDSLSQMVRLIVPVLILLVSYLVINAFFGYVIYRRGVLDLQSALFASSPAGATDISLIAGELGGDMAKIAGIQISRTLYTVIVMPLLIKLILAIWF
ncbi:AbrB family transcriptional regulator [Streptococcus merionis]|uniref:Ammonia monooxygenase n=1 Tax=Streptococcus merionis TaxID=400065 RepID=A0A239STS7_9STRE|nr:AbrB family transcriptional regulator [Streptococcus merionis]SNU88144.1 ammonia monooxygenase [Streptococcus merionis]